MARQKEPCLFDKTRSAAAFSLVCCFISLVFAAHAARARSTYETNGTCDGFPRVDLHTPNGTCVGLVASGIRFTRGVAIKGSTIYAVDMGSWQPHRGRLLAFDQNGHGAEKVLLSGLDRPNGLAFTTDGQLYVGLPDRVLRVNLHEDGAADAQDSLIGLPSSGRHPLKTLTADHKGGLYVSEGSASNNCETPAGDPPNAEQACPEVQGNVPRASILYFKPQTSAQPVSRENVVATGLRNPAALAVTPTDVLLAAANGRDRINAANPALSDDTLPHEPFLVVQKDHDYGWPYCYDNGKPAPEYPNHDCSGVTMPDLLLPAHAAPLGMLVYHGDAFPELHGKVIMTYHGYRDTGHRVVSLTIDPNGKPVGNPQPVIDGWRNPSRKGGPAMGSPVALAAMNDGTLLISEDHNGTILRLARDGATAGQ